MNLSFLQKQNIYLKFFFVIVLLFLIYLADIKTVSLLFIINILFFFPIFPPFLKVMIKLSYFWIFYLLCGFLFNIDYLVQVNFLLHMAFMIHISVFLQKTICFHILLYDIKPLLKFTIIQIIILFFVNLCSLLKYLSNSYKETSLQKLPLSEKLTLSYIEKIILLIKSVIEDTDNRCKVDDIKPDEYLELGSRSWSNIYIIIVIIVFIIETFYCNGC